ncbi:IclR family transcriptional regulator [Halobaculum sp. D14]|uniref:IclR family transcriptional regulator n=1 Tax=Halobaculum sp. D14 TaxID=3421642 RepID=UPI003EC038D4
MGEYPVEATATTFRVIAALDEAGTAGVTELADRLDLSKSAVHNHLATLERLEYAINEDGRYRLSLRFLDHGTSVRDSLPVVTAGREEVDSLASQSGSTAFLVVPEGDVAVYAYVTTGGRGDGRTTGIRAGTRIPLHACAPGKAILSTRTAEAVQAYLDRQPPSPRTDQPIASRDELRSVRDRGIAFDRGGALEGLNAVAAPVTDGETAVAAMGVSGPAAQLTGKRLQEDLPGLVLNHVTSLELALRD